MGCALLEQERLGYPPFLRLVHVTSWWGLLSGRSALQRCNCVDRPFFLNFLMITSTSFHWAVTSWLTQWEMTASSYPRRRQPFPPTGTDLQRRITSHVHSSNWFYSAFSLVVVSEAYRLVWLNCCSSVFSYTFSFLLSVCSAQLIWLWEAHISASLWKFQPCSQTNSTSF